MSHPEICHTRWPYFQKLLKIYNYDFEPTYHYPEHWGGNQQKIKGFEEYNYLLDINSCFSNRPSTDMVDRTGTVQMPFKINSGRLWKKPSSHLSLEECFEKGVERIESKYSVVNLLWSGGIDSTAMVVAWLKHVKKAHIRIMYTITSIKENPGLFLQLKQFTNIELVEIGGSVYSKEKFDGCFIHAGASDQITASVDESFFEKLGYQGLQSSWQNYFYNKIKDKKFIEFCEKYFAISGLKIQTLLEARWWFYAMNKYKGPVPLTLLSKTNEIESFFDDENFENFFYFNTDKLFASTSWQSYKKFFKDYTFNFYPEKYYRDNKCKENSGNWSIFLDKDQFVKKKEYIMALTDGTLITTNNLPLFSEYEYRKKYNNTLDYLFKKE